MTWQDLNLTYLLMGGGIVALLLAVSLWRWWRGRGRPGERVDRELLIDVASLDSSGSPEDGPRLELYGTPVRLAVVVVAPGGRGGELPPSGVLPGLMERVVPGMSDVIARHQPMICRWPEQLSSRGFMQAFFNRIVLPGTKGKGSPWCSIAGKLAIGERSFLIGLVLCASRINSLGQVVVRHEGQWLDVLRIRE